MNSKARTSELRYAKRANVDKPASLIFNQQVFSVRVINISITGVGILYQHALLPQEQITLKIELNLHGQVFNLNLKGKIVHTTQVQTQFLIGIEFYELSDYSKRIINQYVNQSLN
jgi:c-di-GMP-binding flagellar brake protein YcgR